MKNLDFKNHPYTSIAAILVIAIFPLAVAFGWITVEQKEEYAGYLTQLAQGIEAHTWGAVISVVAAIILAFVKDPKRLKKVK